MHDKVSACSSDGQPASKPTMLQTQCEQSLAGGCRGVPTSLGCRVHSYGLFPSLRVGYTSRNHRRVIISGSKLGCMEGGYRNHRYK